MLRAALVLALLACAPRAEPVSPDRPAPPPPALAGRTVMLIPAQPAPSPDVAAVPGLDADLAFFLAERAPRVRWMFPDRLERALQNAPTLRVRLHELDVAAFHRARLDRIGEPLFSELHSLGVLLDAPLALLPYAAGYVPSAGGGNGRVEVQVALIDVTDGDVLWIGAVAGDPGPPDAAAATATAASALAALLVR